MLSSGRILVCFVVLNIGISLTSATNSSTKFTIVLQTPGKLEEQRDNPHKAIHVKYTLPNGAEQCRIRTTNPTSSKAIKQLTVHLCNSITQPSIWYDDSSVCDRDQSMLIYQWTPLSSVLHFFSNDASFAFSRSQSIILTVIYRKERPMHTEQTGIILYISTQPTRFQMGTILAGNKQHQTQFSCRSTTHPRLLYGVKKLTSEKDPTWWRIHTIRIRQFGRKLVQLVLDSDSLANRNQSQIEMVPSDPFLMAGDYLLIECENRSQGNCYFLLYFLAKSKDVLADNTCRENQHSKLFKYIPARTIVRTIKTSNIDGSTIFLILSILLFIIWISTIIGCIIMRRIRGLVNFRPEPPSSLDSQKNKFGYRLRSPHDNYNQRTGDADHIMQIDGEHAGLIA